MYKIGIDCRFWGIKHAGLGRYTRELVLEIIKVCNKNIKFVLFFYQDEWRKDKLALSKCQIIETGVPHYSIIKEQYELKNIIDRENLDLMHFTHFNVPIFLKTPFIVTIHDLIKHFFRGRPVTTRSLPVYWVKYGGYRLVIAQAIKNSMAIITPSYFTKDQIAVHYIGMERKVSVIYEGVSEPFNIASAREEAAVLRVRKKYNLNKPYFVYTGSAYASKNIEGLLLAFKQLLEKYPDIQLLIACARSYFWDKLKLQIERMGLENTVKLPGSVPDSELVNLYQGSEAFVMPSFMEGFGLPALEAMASGTIILSSNTGSLPEIYGRNAIYFNPSNIDKITGSFEFVLNMEKSKRLKIIKSGIEYTRNFRWQKAASKTVDIYNQVLKNRN